MKSAPLLDCVVPAQVLSEFLNVVRRKNRAYFEEACAQAGRWADILSTLATRPEDVLQGAILAKRHNLQLWDSIILEIARATRAGLFLSEDLQDHLTIEGMKILNPFDPANSDELHNLLASADDEIAW